MAKKAKIPSPFLTLGLAGLIPFVLCLAGIVLGDATIAHWAKIALVGYAAVILSFLGGIKWGASLKERNGQKQWSALLSGTVPALIGWSALLVNSYMGLGLLIVGFGLQYFLDIASVNAGQAPKWYARLRLLLTLSVGFLLFVALIILWFGIRF